MKGKCRESITQNTVHPANKRKDTNRTYVDAVVVKVKVFVVPVRCVGLGTGQELTNKMADDVNGLCCHVERDARRMAEASKTASVDILNKR